MSDLIDINDGNCPNCASAGCDQCGGMPTPKTDAAIRYTGEYGLTIDRRYPRDVEVVHIEFARDLERQNAELVEAALKVTRSEHSNVGAMVMVRDSDMDELRAVLAKAGAK